MVVSPSFRIHPAKNTWIDIVIWPSPEDLHSDTDNRLPPPEHPDEHDHKACFIAPPYRLRENGSGPLVLITRKLGEIHLIEDDFGAGIVAHEIQHFISHWQVLWEWDVVEENWEDVAHLAGNLTAEFWSRWWDMAGTEGELP